MTKDSGTLGTPSYGVFIIFLFVFIAGCAGLQSEVQNIYKEKKMTIQLVQKRQRSGEVIAKGYQHPWEIDTQTLDYLLKNIKYERGGLFTKSDPEQVFPDDDRRVMLKPLQKAFNTAGPDQAIEFSFIHRKQWLLFKRDSFTDGILFRKGEQLNCAFRNIALKDLPEGNYENAYEGDPTKTPFQTSWTLVPGEGQQLVSTEGKGRFGKNDFTNWIVINLAAVNGAQQIKITPQSGEQADSAQVTPPQEADDPNESLPLTRGEIEKRLQFLKELFEEGALSPAAYEEKKKVLEKHYELLPEGSTD